MRILDAGCGGGRNLLYFFQEGYDVSGLDRDPQAIAEVRSIATSPRNFQVGSIEALPYADSWFDVVISSAVLHFAQDEKQFEAMLHSMWRVLKVNGILFCRLASSIGMEKRMRQIKGRRFLLPDGSERYLVDETLLTNFTRELRAELADPIKTTIVQNERCMTTWVLRKT